MWKFSCAIFDHLAACNHLTACNHLVACNKIYTKLVLSPENTVRGSEHPSLTNKSSSTGDSFGQNAFLHNGSLGGNNIINISINHNTHHPGVATKLRVLSSNYPEAAGIHLPTFWRYDVIIWVTRQFAGTVLSNNHNHGPAEKIV